MKPFTVHSGLVAPMDRANVDTDMIIPKQFLKSIKRTGFGPNLFDELRYLDEGHPGQDCSDRPLNPEFPLNQPRYQGASILLARDNFGCGSSREHAPWALEDFGFRCIIAPSFADIFYNNCFKNGVLPIALDADTVESLFQALYAGEGFTLTIDLEQQTVSGQDGTQIRFEIEQFRRHRLLHGLDEIGLTLQYADDIRRYEADLRSSQPWLFGAGAGEGGGLMGQRVLVLPGDHIGPEVAREGVRVLESVSRRFSLDIEIEEALLGGAALDAEGAPLPDATMEAARRSDAIMLGAVGGPEWDSVERSLRPERGLLGLRSGLELFGNLRPALLYPQLAEASSLKSELVAGLDLLIVRELTGGIYFGEPRGIRTLENGERQGYNTYIYSESEIERIGRLAFESAQKRGGKLCSVDKSNVLEVTVLWREVMTALAADYPDVELSHMYVDNAAMQLIRAPKQFDVMVTGNMFGDILSDAAAMLTGSIGMLPSASLNAAGVGMYEPCHGSAPDISGQGKANPLAMILSVAMMLRYSLDHGQAAVAIEEAVNAVLDSGLRTPDIVSPGTREVGTVDMADAVLAEMEKEASYGS